MEDVDKVAQRADRTLANGNRAVTRKATTRHTR